MSHLKLLYFEGCPHAETAKEALKSTGLEFEVVKQDDLTSKHPLKSYSSPAILLGDQIIFGAKLDAGASACSAMRPNAEEIKKSLARAMASPSSPERTNPWVTLGSWGSALIAVFCPSCIPALVAGLSAIGLGFTIQESFLHPLFVVLLLFALGGLFWSYRKEHGILWPFAIGLAVASALYFGRYAPFGGTPNMNLVYLGAAGMILVNLWNFVLRRRPACRACELKGSL